MGRRVLCICAHRAFVLSRFVKSAMIVIVSSSKDNEKRRLGSDKYSLAWRVVFLPCTQRVLRACLSLLLQQLRSLHGSSYPSSYYRGRRSHQLLLRDRPRSCYSGYIEMLNAFESLVSTLYENVKEGPRSPGRTCLLNYCARHEDRAYAKKRGQATPMFSVQAVAPVFETENG